jgi:hypothetical protein
MISPVIKFAKTPQPPEGATRIVIKIISPPRGDGEYKIGEVLIKSIPPLCLLICFILLLPAFISPATLFDAEAYLAGIGLDGGTHLFFCVPTDRRCFRVDLKTSAYQPAPPPFSEDADMPRFLVSEAPVKVDITKK